MKYRSAEPTMTYVIFCASETALIWMTPAIVNRTSSAITATPIIAESFVAAQAIGDESDHHAEPGGAEAEGPAHPLAEDARNKGGDECADIDSHVENREASVAPRSALGIEITDDRRDIRLEESGAHHDENQADVERGVREDDRERDRQV